MNEAELNELEKIFARRMETMRLHNHRNRGHLDIMNAAYDLADLAMARVPELIAEILRLQREDEEQSKSIDSLTDENLTLTAKISSRDKEIEELKKERDRLNLAIMEARSVLVIDAHPNEGE